MHRLRFVSFVLILASVLLVPVPSAGAAPGLQYWYGTVTRVSDGDTLYVDVAGDTKGGLPVRNLGIQATETGGGPGGGAECHALEAKARMTQLLPVGTKVRLSAYYASSSSGVDGWGVTRMSRYVDKWNPATSRYDVDVQLDLLRKGHVLWGADRVENARAASYRLPSQLAMRERLGLFSPHYCKAGPAIGAALPMWIHWDANAELANEEWLRIRNRGTTAVSLAGWKLRDSGHSFYAGGTYYTFPAGASIPAGATITVYPGNGVTSVAAGRYYLKVRDTAFFPNATAPVSGLSGKPIYLLDPDLDFRGWADYPCLTGCSRPPVHIANVQPKTLDEYVDLRLDAGVTAAVDLSGVEVTNDGWAKELAPGTVLRPGETLRVYCDRAGTDTRLTQYWGHTSGTMLEDGGDTVVLRTAQAVTLSTYRWGTG